MIVEVSTDASIVLSFIEHVVADLSASAKAAANTENISDIGMSANTDEYVIERVRDHAITGVSIDVSVSGGVRARVRNGVSTGMSAVVTVAGGARMTVRMVVITGISTGVSADGIIVMGGGAGADTTVRVGADMNADVRATAITGDGAYSSSVLTASVGVSLTVNVGVRANMLV